MAGTYANDWTWRLARSAPQLNLADVDVNLITLHEQRGIDMSGSPAWDYGPCAEPVPRTDCARAVAKVFNGTTSAV